jgi:hypothetical protein
MSEFLFHSGGILKPIGMIKGYIDESGTHQGSKVLIVAGYVGNSEVWNSVEARFKKADKHAGIPFHAVDCATGGKAYQGMHKDKRNRITKKMVKIINDHDIFGIGYCLWIDDYESIYRRNGEHWETWLAKPFTLLFQGVVHDMCQYVEEHYPGEKLSLVVEDSPHWYPSAAKKFIATKKEKHWTYASMLETIAPYSSEDAVQLYAPDLLAYETYLMKKRERFPTIHGKRESMLALLKKRLEGRIWDKDGLMLLEKFLDETSGFNEDQMKTWVAARSKGV